MQIKKIGTKEKRDLYLLAGIILVATLAWFGYRSFFKEPAIQVEVTIDGKIVEMLPLDEHAEITIHGYANGTNQLVIENGEAFITDASCPDKKCIHQGKIKQTGEIIVCLPNYMIIKIVGEE